MGKLAGIIPVDPSRGVEIDFPALKVPGRVVACANLIFSAD